ncbi:40S ribosomal protein S19-like [Mustela erminea]|uniref:40S ribosomal protein S19-like n=1 Tax=Mustela erminea TaxID=36723 RepID=UPI001386F454|nr:40S ribosomal protein S19-like [Mustela erminea]
MPGIFPSGQTLEALPELSRDLSPELHAGRRRGRLRSGGVRAGLWALPSLQSVWGREPAAGVLRALAAFLEESGKLKAPEWAGGGVPKARASRREDGFGVRAACPARHLSLPGGAGGSSGPGARGGAKATLRHTQPLQRTPQAPQGLEMMRKDEDGGCELTAKGEPGRLAGQL